MKSPLLYQDKESTLLPSLKQQLRECEKSIQNMLNAIEAGIITPSTKQRLQDLETRREELNISILQEQLQKPRFTKEQIVAWISRFKYGDPDDLEYQKQIIDTFVNSVYVYDDRLVMTYNYKDGTETISLDAVYQAFGSDLSSDAPLTWFDRTRFLHFYYASIKQPPLPERACSGSGGLYA